MATTLDVMEAWSAASGIYDAKSGANAVTAAIKRDRPVLAEKFDFSDL